MSRKVIITQSNYIPWKGYFDGMALVDEFILYDDVQFTKRDWRNRNLIKTLQGLKWLTIPVEVKGKYFQKIKDTKVCNGKWVKDHLKSIKFNYVKSKCYQDVFPFLEDLYLKAENLTFLTDINYLFLLEISKFLKINIKIKFSWEYPYESNDKNIRLLEICKLSGATDYFSGPAAKNYMNIDLFMENNIKVHWLDYTGYREYEQLYPPFVHGVSILDLMLNLGSDSRLFLKNIHKTS
jgi:hypothetical protein